MMRDYAIVVLLFTISTNTSDFVEDQLPYMESEAYYNFDETDLSPYMQTEAYEKGDKAELPQMQTEAYYSEEIGHLPYLQTDTYQKGEIGKPPYAQTETYNSGDIGTLPYSQTETYVKGETEKPPNSQTETYNSEEIGNLQYSQTGTYQRGETGTPPNSQTEVPQSLATGNPPYSQTEVYHPSLETGIPHQTHEETSFSNVPMPGQPKGSYITSETSIIQPMTRNVNDMTSISLLEMARQGGLSTSNSEVTYTSYVASSSQSTSSYLSPTLATSSEDASAAKVTIVRDTTIQQRQTYYGMSEKDKRPTTTPIIGDILVFDIISCARLCLESPGSCYSFTFMSSKGNNRCSLFEATADGNFELSIGTVFFRMEV